MHIEQGCEDVRLKEVKAETHNDCDGLRYEPDNMNVRSRYETQRNSVLTYSMRYTHNRSM
jgi:hypothetical protein